MSLSKASDVAYLTQHVFLPKRIQHNLENISTERKNAAVFSLFLSTLQELQKNINFPKLNKIVKCFHDWQEIQCRDSDGTDILHKLQELKETDNFLPFFARSQNALIGFEFCGDGKLLINASKVSLQNKETTDQLVDRVRHFPGPVFNIPVSRVVNKSLAQQLETLDNHKFEEEQPSYRKKGENIGDNRDLPDTSYVTDWLFPTLIGTENEISVAQFKTKMRDKVELEIGNMPWRRSGLYNCAKLVLHYLLLKHFGKKEGPFLYKLCMVQLANTVLESHKELRDVDLEMQIISKIAVKVKKLSNMLKESSNLSDELVTHAEKTFKQAHSRISKSKAKLDNVWEWIQNGCASNSNIVIETSNLNFVEDTKMLLPKISAETEKWKTELRGVQSASTSPKGLQRCTDSFPDLNCSDEASVETTQKLLDAEVFIRSIWFNDQSTSTSEVLRIMKTYYQLASNVYASDPVRHSVCVLTCFTLIAILDQITARAYPILNEYSPSVDLTCFNHLLLPQRSQMEHLKSIAKYFKVRQSTAKKPGILEKCTDKDSIGVIYAASNSLMQKTKRQILEEAERKRNNKMQEVRQAYANYESLQTRIKNYGACDEHRYYDSWNGVHKTKHSKYCRKCSMETEASEISVSYYERPLPDDENERNAIMFEFNCPTEIGHLRDALHFFNLSFFKQTLVKSSYSSSYMSDYPSYASRFKSTWSSYSPVSRYANTTSFSISIGSTTSLTCLNHYASGHPRNDPSGESFIKRNGYNVHLIDKSSGYVLGYKNEPELKEKCIIKAPGIYSNMQWAIDSTTHSDNEAICRQSECPALLTLKEFKAFCSARAGSNLQLRNLLASIVLDTLSFHQEGVVALITQILWETGPTEASDHSFGRDSQFDLTNDLFLIEFTQVLERVVSVIEENWDRNYVLLNWVYIAQRLLEFSVTDSTRDRMVLLLRKCRKTGLKWLNKLNELSKNEKDTTDGGRSLRHKTVITGLIVSETFSCSSYFTKYLVNSSQDVVDWLQALSSVNDNILLNGADSSADSQTKSLVQRAWRTGLSIHETLKTIIKADSDTLTNFAELYWLDSDNQYIGDWVSNKDPWYETRSNNCRLNINILTGSFLVNGNPISRLPESITKSSLYSSFFKSKVFFVLPGSEPETFVTSGKFSGSIFEFRQLPGNKLRIVDIREDGGRYRFVPPSLLQGELPVDMVDQYSHWWTENGTKPCLLFRSKTMYDKQFSKTSCDYALYSNPGTKLWTLNQTIDVIDAEQNGRSSLVGIGSSTFKEFYEKVFRKLDHHSNIHMFFDDEKPEEIKVKLPRLGLSFICYSSGDIQSFEFTGMQVCKRQTLGTLIGLQSGLLLVDSACRDIQKLIIPHGELIEKTDLVTNHSSISVNFANHSLKSPAFFVYGVNQRLQMLTAPSSYNAWLYLALLHMKTAYPIPDPFTKMTGHEMTGHILRSARCFSPDPLTDTDILEQILRCVPQRGFYVEHARAIQKIKWPEHPRYSTCCSETIYFLCNKIHEHSDNISQIFPKLQTKLLEPDNDKKNHEFLTKKAYLQYESTSSPSAQLSLLERETVFEDVDLKPSRLQNKTRLKKSQSDEVSIRILSSRRDDDQFTILPDQPDLIKLLIEANHRDLPGSGRSKFVSDSNILTWGDFEFAKCWIDLFNFALTAEKTGYVEELHNILTFLLFKSKMTMEHALAISFVARNPEPFRAITIIDYASFEKTNEYALQTSDIKLRFMQNREAVRVTRTSYVDSNHRNVNDTPREHDEKYGKEYETKLKNEANSVAEVALLQWPASSCTIEFPCQIFITSVIVDYVNPLFHQRFANLKLKQFLEKVQTCFSAESEPGMLPNLVNIEWKSQVCAESLKNWQEFDLNWNEVDVEPFDIKSIFNTGKLEFGKFSQDGGGLNQLREIVQTETIDVPPETLNAEDNSQYARHMFNTFCINNSDPVAQSFFERLQESLDAHINTVSEKATTCPSSERLGAIKDILASFASLLGQYVSRGFGCKDDDYVDSCIEKACLNKRPVPLNFLPLILQSTGDQDDQCVNLIGALAVIWTQEQRIERCLQHLERNKVVYLQGEWANTGHTNWSPAERPEWLLLELEQNWLVRPVQVDIALKMLKPPENKNTVMQLNMGEGKTSVIVPLLIASMSKMKDVLPQVITLSSLFPSNCNSLTDKLGGLLNLKLFTLPFRRHVKLSRTNLRHTINVIKHDIMCKGFVVTVPEYLMSFHLKVIEHCRGEDDAANEFMELQNLLDTNVRSVLDESDEILHVKRQLVYTLGSQVDVGGKSQRWIVMQQLLFSVKRHLTALHEQFGDSQVLLKMPHDSNSHHFPVEFRLVSSDKILYSKLCELICDDLFSGKIKVDLPPMSAGQKELTRHFVTSEEISRDQLKIFNSTCEIGDIIMITRGLLAFKVLQHCFSLRYKVNYGVGPHRKMAVPFRAKDVAAEKTEFGHPDVALVLTQLSYYYQGLPDDALNEVFQRLMQLDVAYAESLYSDWVSQCNPDSVHKSLQKLSGVNLSDMDQKHSLLFPLFRKHMDTINYWLAHFVYPKECKQFPHKLVSNGWDLCPKLPNPVTGFSGTNDTQQLLPPTISQCDLPELISTNGSVIANLLRPENQVYQRIPIGMEAKDVLRQMLTTFPGARVILDVGALIIQMDNRQVAHALLDLAPVDSVHAAIYFDARDQMVVVDRKKKVQKLHLSPFSEKLDKVITYLDEIHTRGTDLQFPSGTQAIVTLGKGLQKDRLVQACMRMRLLGKGHSVSFFATDEVHRAISDVTGVDSEPDTTSVLKWTMANSVKQIQDGLVNWSHQGLCRLQKNLAHQKLQVFNSLKDFGGDCTFRDILDLEEMYASERERKLHHVIMKTMAVYIREDFDDYENNEELNQHSDVSAVIVSKCQELIPEKLSFVNILDEEQERELEQEQEEEVEIVRPSKQDHKKPEVPLCVKNLVEAGTVCKDDSEGFQGLYKALKNTRIWGRQLKSPIKAVQISPQFSEVADQGARFHSQINRFDGSSAQTRKMLYRNIRNNLDDYLRDPLWVMMQNETEQLYLLTPHEVNELFREILASDHVTLFMFTPAVHKNQIMVLHESASLSIPPGRKLTFPEKKARTFGELHMFAGNLFFRSSIQEDMYCWYLGLVPQPRSEEEEAAFEAGLIEPRGFVRKEHRAAVGLQPNRCPFEENPIDLANSLISLRGHGDIMLSSHAYMILFRGRRNLTDS